MKSKLLLVLCAGGLTMTGSAVADPDRQPPPDQSPPIANPPPKTDPLPPQPVPTGPITPGTPAPTTPTATDPTAPALPPPVEPAPPPPAPVTTDPMPTETTPYSERPSVYSWNDARLRTGIGVGLTIGGGIAGFTDKAMRDTVSSDVSGLWNFRATIGTHIPVGLDLNYIGSAGSLRTLTGASNGTLIGSTAEAAVRWNITPHELFNPYVFAGAGWQRYDVRNMSFATSDTGLANHDNILEIPMGAGLGYRDPSGFVIDLRGTFRAAATDSKLVLEPNGNYASMHTWEASGSLGYEF